MQPLLKISFGLSVFLLTIGSLTACDCPELFLVAGALAVPSLFIPSRPFQIIAGILAAIALLTALYQYLHPAGSP